MTVLGSCSITNVLQCDTPLATYAHLAPCEPIAHPGRGMPVLSSTVHIDRHASLRWFQTIYGFLLTHLCMVMFSGRPCGRSIGGIFFGTGTCQELRRSDVPRGKQSGKTPFVKIHDTTRLFTPTHLHGKIQNSTVLQGFAQWGIRGSSFRGQWPRQRQHRPCDAICA